MSFLKKNILLFLLPLVLFVTLFLYSYMPSVDIMELRNFITAREMLEDGSWLLPTLNGELRIAKPPLPTWVTAISMKIAGTDANLTADRIPSGICALFLVLFTFLLARRISVVSGYALTTILILSTSYLFMFSARENEWGIYACTAMSGALWAMREAFSRERGKNAYLFLFSLLMTVSFFSKGPVAFWVMLLPFILSYGITYGTKDIRDHKWGLFWCFILCALLSATWPAYVYLNTPHTAVAIASRESGAWFARHKEPVWYYITHLPVIAGLWTPFLLYGIAVPFLVKDRKPEERFLVYWFILTIIFLSVFPEKKQRYLFPAVLPAALLSSMALFRLRETRGLAWKIVYGVFSFLSGILFVSAGGYLAYLGISRGNTWALPGGPFLVFTGAFIIYQFIRKKTDNAHLTAIAGICLSLVFMPPLIASLPNNDDTFVFMSLRDDPAIKGRQLYSVGELRLKYIWAAGRKIRPITEDRIPDLNNRGAGIALISPQKLNTGTDRLRFQSSIKADEVYYIYLIN
jgi:4-amino-4-deoxy-L-arabinose transferase-like glycosyltransferase